MIARNATIASKMYDEGLRKFMINMYNHTALGLAVSGFIAYLVFTTGMVYSMGALMWVFMFAPLGMILYYGFAGQNWSLQGITRFYYLFTAVMGVSMSTIFVVYTMMSIAQVFFITSATFAAASLYGYTTKRDLTTMGSFLIVGLIGIIIASIVNIFLASSAFAFAISILGVLIFVGMTAWDTQTAKNLYISAPNMDVAEKYGVQMALSLYLDFVNLFQFLLALLGNRE
jgi:FtsH-binding integral membrane protein|tara:strand:+ start:10180 stop:10866 length:687 start_codon:yes stop_codon:yes gene_type:complete